MNKIIITSLSGALLFTFNVVDIKSAQADHCAGTPRHVYCSHSYTPNFDNRGNTPTYTESGSGRVISKQQFLDKLDNDAKKRAEEARKRPHKKSRTIAK